MRQALWIAVLAAGCAATAPCEAAGGSVADQAVTLTYGATHWGGAPMVDLTGADAAGDPLYQAGVWYRIGTATRETPVPVPDSETYADGTVTATWNDLGGTSIRLQEITRLFDGEGPSGGFTTRLVVQNLSATEQAVTLFHYLDPDAGASSANDSGALVTPTFLKFSDGSSRVTYRGRSFGDLHYQVAAFPALRALLDDTALTNLSDAGLPFGPGDASAAFEFGPLVVPAGEAYVLGDVMVGVGLPHDHVKGDYFGLAGQYSPLYAQSADLTTSCFVQMRRTTQLDALCFGLPAGSTLAGVDDFDADLLDEVVSRTAAGAVYLDYSPLTGAPTLALNWKLSATGDFDADGKADILWRNTTSQKLVVWTMNGSAKIGNIIPSPDQAVDANWEVAAAADFNGDGHRDLLWYNQTTGKIVLWFMNGSVQRITGQFTNPATVGNNNWKVLAAGDFGKGPGGLYDTQDVVWQNDTSKKIVVWFMDLAGNRTGGTFTSPDILFAWYTLAGPR